MRYMYDAVNPENLPSNGDLYAGYVDGLYVNVDRIKARFPNKKVVTLSVNGSHDADVLDVEPFNISPENAPGWVLRQRARGGDPTVYTQSSWWPRVRTAFFQQGVAEPHYWIAKYDGNQNIPAGAVAKQFGGDTPGGWDISSVEDYWPGIDNPNGEFDVTPDEVRTVLAEFFNAANPPSGIGEQGSAGYILRDINFKIGALFDRGALIDHINSVVTGLSIPASPAGVSLPPDLVKQIADEFAKRLVS